MTTKITKWGNSLGLRIPQEIVKKYHLYDGAPVSLTTTVKGALITPLREKPSGKRLPTLKQALANFRENMIEKVEWGNDVGKEIVR